MRDDLSTPAELLTVEAFLNTVDERTFSRHGIRHNRHDVLTTPAALSSWLAAQGLIGQATRASTSDLAAATALRAALRSAVTLRTGQPPDRNALHHANTALAEFPLCLELDHDGALRLAMATSGVRRALAAIVATVAQSNARGTWSRMRICSAPDCHWAFFDNSRNAGGRWCSMAVCGNRDKTRRYRERTTRAEAG